MRFQAILNRVEKRKGFVSHRVRFADDGESSARSAASRSSGLPGADGKHQSTYSLRIFLAAWAKRLSWKETATIFQTSWDTVFRAIDRAVR